MKHATNAVASRVRTVLLHRSSSASYQGMSARSLGEKGGTLDELPAEVVDRERALRTCLQDRSFQRVPVFDLVHGVELAAATGSAGPPVVLGDVVAWISVDAPEPNWRGSIGYIRGR